MGALFRKHFWVVYLLLAACCAFLIGKGAAHFLKMALAIRPASVVTKFPFPKAIGFDYKMDVPALVKKNPFCPTCDLPKVSDNADSNGTPVRSSLPFKLLSTFMFKDWTASSAIIQQGQQGKDYALVKRGDVITGTNDAVVLQIIGEQVDQPARVYIQSNGRIEYIDAEASDSPAPARPIGASKSQPDMDLDSKIRCKKPGNCEVDRSLIDGILSNMSSLFQNNTQIQMAGGRDGKPGAKISLRPGSILGRIGMQSGDFIQEVNGIPVSSPDKALEAYVKLKTASHITISIERNGQPVSIEAQIR